MAQKKKHLVVVRNESDSIVKNVSCFGAHEQYDVDCHRKKCPNWIAYADGHNCVMIAAREGPHTLQEIGAIYGLTRMRICQVEKTIIEKIREIGLT